MSKLTVKTYRSGGWEDVPVHYVAKIKIPKGRNSLFSEREPEMSSYVETFESTGSTESEAISKLVGVVKENARVLNTIADDIANNRVIFEK